LNSELTVWLLVFLRMSALLAVFPVFSGRNFPVQLRLALGVLVAALIVPGLPAINLVQLSLGKVVGLMIGEVLVGLLLGFISRMLFFALDLAGGIITQEMGLNMASSLNPLSETHTEVPGMILYYLAAVLFLSLDFHHWLLAGLQRSYTLLPIGGAHLRAALLPEVVGRTSQVFGVALQMAAPFIAVSFLITLVFAVLGRAVPQMNVFTESFAVRTLAGLAVFGLTLNLTAQHMMNHLRRLPEDVLRVAQLLGG